MIFSNLPYSGYLCNIPVMEFEHKFKHLLPETIRGTEFIALHNRTIDRVTTVNGDSRYSILNCTAHPIYENERVPSIQVRIDFLSEFPGRIIQGIDFKEYGRADGTVPHQHSQCGLGADRTDEIIALARKSMEKAFLEQRSPAAEAVAPFAFWSMDKMERRQPVSCISICKKNIRPQQRFLKIKPGSN